MSVILHCNNQKRVNCTSIFYCLISLQLMAAEKKARAEAEELRNQIKKNQDNERKERRKLADEEALKKIKALEDQLQSLQKNLASQKQVGAPFRK